MTAGSMVDNKALHGKTIQPFVCATSFGIAGFPAALIGLLILSTHLWSQALLVIMAGVLFISAAWLYYEVLAREDVSRVVPLLRPSSLQTLLFGMFFLVEMLNARQWITFLFLLGSSFLLSCKQRIRTMLSSWTALRELSATTLLALSGVLLADLYRSTFVWVGITWEKVGMAHSITALTLLRIRGTHRWLSLASHKDWSILMGDQTVRLFVQGTTALAIAHCVPVAFTSTLSGANLVWVRILALTRTSREIRYFTQLQRKHRNEFWYLPPDVMAEAPFLYVKLDALCHY
jgi:hypothetical protein